jgi:hypothetical protein
MVVSNMVVMVDRVIVVVVVVVVFLLILFEMKGRLLGLRNRIVVGDVG